MTPRTGAGGAAVLFAALFPAACLQTVMLPPPPQAGGTGGGSADDGGNPGGGGAGDRDGGLDHSTICNNPNTSLAIRRPWPSIVVAVDHTNSMISNRLGGNDSKLEAVASALKARLNKYGPVVRFGYVEFPGMSRSCSNMTSACCVSAVTQPAANTENGIISTLDQCNPLSQGCGLGDTAPTAQMLRDVGDAYNELLANTNPVDQEWRSILLLTDGEPGCPLGSSSSDPCMQATSEIARLNIQGITTSVVAVGDVPGDLDTHGANKCLNSMANVSGVVRSTVSPFYFPVMTESQLGNTLTSIITEAVCHLELLDLPADRDRTTIQLGMSNSSGGTTTVTVPRDTSHTNGWDYEKTADTKVVFYGAACGNFIDTILTGGLQRVRVQGCPVPPAH